MVKRISLIMGTLALAFTLTACAGQVEQLATLSTSSESSGIEREPVDAADFSDDLDGLCKYMEASQAVAGEKDYMSYKEIGAIDGCRYRFKYDGGTIQAEFYEFDLENLDEKGQECVNSVNEKGSFTVLGNEAPAVLSGKYLMVYADSDSDEVNKAHKDEVLELFNNFRP